jgi:hypothetical protein
MMYSFEAKTSLSKKVIQYQLFEADRLLQFAEVIAKWKNEADFRAFYTKILAKSPFEGFYWEHPPLTKDNLQANYEFILYEGSRLSLLKPDTQSFAEYFDQVSAIEGVVSFMNIGKNALLIVPCPLSQAENYTHLGAFVRQAPEAQIDKLWQAMAQSLENQLNTSPIWLSTAGMGVHWLHIRLDSVPKYYHFQPYKQKPSA